MSNMSDKQYNRKNETWPDKKETTEIGMKIKLVQLRIIITSLSPSFVMEYMKLLS